MSVIAVRTFLAWASVWLAFATFVAFAVYGLYLDQKLAAFCNFEPPPKAERWNPAYYAPEAAPWLARDCRWHRWRDLVWLGSIGAGNALYFLFKP